MSGLSPASILFSSDGYELSVVQNSAIPTGTRALITAGSDGSNARPILVDSTGSPVIVGAGIAGTPSGGVLTIQGVSGGTNLSVSQATAANLNATVVQGNAGTLGQSWFTQITDATNGPVAVKPASTAAVASDPALVVAISPNNTFTTSFGDLTGTGKLNALNATATVALTGEQNVAMQLLAGTLVGTIVPEFSVDGGTTWITGYWIDPTNGAVSSNIVFGSNNTAQTRLFAGVGGASNARVRVSAYTSGSAIADMRASFMNSGYDLYAGAIGSTTLPPLMKQIGGVVTTSAPTYTNNTINTFSLTTAGALRVDNSGVTQPVSGTITANQGTANSLANAWTTQITDTTNGPVAVKAASTAAVAADPALVVAISPNNSIITDKSSSANITSVAGSVTNTSILASNSSRVSATIYNSTNKTMFLALGPTASTTAYTVQIFASSYWELPVSYTGAISAVWASGVSGNALVTELT